MLLTRKTLQGMALMLKMVGVMASEVDLTMKPAQEILLSLTRPERRCRLANALILWWWASASGEGYRTAKDSIQNP